VFIVAILTKVFALQSWWCLDDWGQLARGAGYIGSEDAFPARWLSQQAYWTLTWPIFGDNPAPHALLRIVLHGLASVSLTRIAKSAGLGSTGTLISGLLFAASPIAFTVLIWASGIQELLAGALALFAVERWFAKGPSPVLWVALLGAGSILSKESGLGVPILLAIFLIGNRSRFGPPLASRWISVTILGLLGTLESILVMNHFATGLDDPYRLGGVLVVAGNLGKFGWWLLTQGPVFTGQVSWALAGIGLAFFALWSLWALVALRRKRRLPMATLVAALLSLAPALVLVHQARPYMAYPAMASLALMIGGIWPRRWELGPWTRLLTAAAVVAWGLWGMSTRLDYRDETGGLADPVVRAMEISKVSARFILERISPSDPANDLVIYQPPLRNQDIALAERLGETAVQHTEPLAALGSANGLAVLSGRPNGGRWVNSLLNVGPESQVFCETRDGLKAWGTGRDALVYSALLDILVGHDERAVQQLGLAAEIDPNLDTFVFRADVMDVPAKVLQARLAAFLGRLVTLEPHAAGPQSSVPPVYEFVIDLLGKISASL